MNHLAASYFTTGDVARRLGVPRATVSYALERDRIQPAARAGLVRLFSTEQWPEVVKAVRLIQRRRSR